VDGELRTTLRLQYAYRDIGGYRLFVRTYEGTVPGPTLRVKPGDLLRITLINDLPPNRDPAPVIHSLPHQFNTTNFHSHGLHVSPSGISDNVMRIMEPGKSYDIEIAIHADHIPGTNWYHPHAHGSADVQIASGAVGALIIEGDFADVPEIAAAQERLLVLTEAVFDSFGTIENFETLFPETAARFLAVNGVREPTITMRPGEVQPGAYSMPAGRMIFSWSWRGTCCIRSPAMASPYRGWTNPFHARRSMLATIRKPCSLRRGSESTCWLRRVQQGAICFARLPIIRVILPRPAPLPASWWKAIRCR
jgi:hypothetical protein